MDVHMDIHMDVHMDAHMDAHMDVQMHGRPGDNPNPPLGSTPLFGDPDRFTARPLGWTIEFSLGYPSK